MRYTCEAEKKLIKTIAKDLGSTSEQVMQVVNFQREYVKNVMEHSGFEGVMLPYLGKFKVNPGRLQMLNNKNNELIHGRRIKSGDIPGTAENRGVQNTDSQG